MDSSTGSSTSATTLPSVISTSPAPATSSGNNNAMAPGSPSPNVDTSVTSTSSSQAKVTPYSKSSKLLDDPKLNEILLSDAGPTALLARLKQSIVAAREYGSFVKKAAVSEGEHLSAMKKYARATRDAIKRPESRQGSFSSQFNEIVRVNERLCDVGNSYVAALHIMHDELNELAKGVERSRKSVKETCVRNEKNVMDAEQAVEKAQSKYNSLCEEYEKMRVGDPTKNKFGFKQSRTPQHEEELHKKVTQAEADFQQRVDTNQRMRRDLLTKLRPSAVKQLKDLILEIDAAMAYQLQKYATLNENLALNRGFIVAPVKPQAGPGASSSSTMSPALSLKELSSKVDNELDFYNFVTAIPKSTRLNRPQISFKQHHTLAGAYPTNQSSFSSNLAPVPSSTTPIATTATTLPHTLAPPPVSQKLPTDSTISASPVTPNLNTFKTSDGFRSVSGMTTETVASERTNNTVASNSAPAVSNAYPPGTKNSMPVFGTPLDELLDYEESTVPRVVYQCIQAVDSFGLEVEGIYRANGNSAQVQEIKRLFDLDSTSVDLLRPNENLNDIHSVAAALKLYFRELPDPILTKEFHREFIASAKIEDDIQRRDAIHATINKLPDPNYTTLRYLIFHLYRVQEREAINRMSIVNLGIVWGPTLMATDYSNVGEMALQGKVIETVLLNAFVIFDAE